MFGVKLFSWVLQLTFRLVLMSEKDLGDRWRNQSPKRPHANITYLADKIDLPPVNPSSIAKLLPLGCGAMEELACTSVHTCRAWWRSKLTKAERRHLRETEAATGQQQWLLSAVGALPLSPEPGGSPRAMRRMHSEETARVEPRENSTGLRCDRSRENACAAPPLRQPGAPGRLQDSFLCAPQQTCTHLQRVQTASARTSSPGSPRPRPEPLLPSPQRPDCSPLLARGEALRVPAIFNRYKIHGSKPRFLENQHMESNTDVSLPSS
ncbi:hypothetical protein Celaphus_00017556 [Cervus elaphus hippelaphus]|uniref:Uncharacterized protein n=1 Tax=Cervus elaphus hippelaphus TaxID=46360 RepID=A0A212C6T1_CEREH|nr:hypothetical protein Celaphus_00017556 [Cervus elaphus hippelaphus]